MAIRAHSSSSRRMASTPATRLPARTDAMSPSSNRASSSSSVPGGTTRTKTPGCFVAAWSHRSGRGGRIGCRPLFLVVGAEADEATTADPNHQPAMTGTSATPMTQPPLSRYSRLRSTTWPANGYSRCRGRLQDQGRPVRSVRPGHPDQPYPVLRLGLRHLVGKRHGGPFLEEPDLRRPAGCMDEAQHRGLLCAGTDPQQRVGRFIASVAASQAAGALEHGLDGLPVEDGVHVSWVHLTPYLVGEMDVQPGHWIPSPPPRAAADEGLLGGSLGQSPGLPDAQPEESDSAATSTPTTLSRPRRRRWLAPRAAQIGP